ncbi:MAG: polysaccharide biosynthesis tyrosine autokinase [Clostridiaceae bacterium]|nr:polysaccharide biosynthesis tyrosine autokinase [Clostridiaceae bacterium]MBW4859671.1 polysaccharide biosynthesis tyrosine autokinase [Clostridiaceae bacterium]MBW4868792.1 polysaccharide biosynthesis tyrosine autokinase [Clostridiaceae bacterium]
MEEMDLKDCFIILNNKKKLIIGITILSILLVGIFNYLTFSPKYEVSAKVMLNELEDFEGLEGDQSYINRTLINNYSEIIKSEIVMDEVKKNLEVELKYEEIVEKLDVEILPETNFIIIKAIGSNPKNLTSIVNEITKTSIKYAKKLIHVKNIKVVDKAQLPDAPMKSGFKKNITIGGIVGLSLGIFLAFFLEYLNDTIRTSKDIKRYLDLPIVGILPFVKKELVTKKEPKSFAAESYRSLKTNINYLKVENQIKSILITSPTLNEENVTVVVNLAISMAQGDEKILLIDGDLRKPNVHKFFDMENNYGLSNVLNEDINYKEVIKEVKNNSNLDILTSGPILSRSIELLNSKDMKSFINKVSNEYDTIIINGPSLGGVSDSILLSTIVDSILLICTSGQSKVNEFRIGKDLINNINPNILGIVLNGVKNDKDTYSKYLYNNYLYYNDI